METLRALYWLHYPGSGPKATLWDIWLAPPSLWPAVETGGSRESMRQQWSDVLSSRVIDRDGYVSVHQHPSIAHPMGWPFPFWHQGQGGYGWHFSFKDTIGPPWRPEHANDTTGWQVSGATDKGIDEAGWNLKLTSPHVTITAPEQDIDTFNAPFVQLRWKATGLGNAQPFIEWTTKEEPEFGRDRRFYFEPIENSTAYVHTAIPLYKHPKWKGHIKQLRVNFGNSGPADVTVQALFTQYDTRHDITGQLYLKGCAAYFWWTRDINFLRNNINRMRTALRYVQTEHRALDQKMVVNDWVGHDGRSGLKVGKGQKEILYGHGIGDNYWDLLPCGNKDAYATILYYSALKDMAMIEREVLEHPEWNLPVGVLAFDPAALEKHAEEVKAQGNRLFWNAKNGRFILGIDADGKTHDYGYTFLNLEAIYYGFATPEHAREIISWIDGERVVEGDTAQKEDIYHWRMAPRATTKRNTDFYFWGWNAPEGIPWGGQVQDGGAVLGFSYHDLMARLELVGPDNTWGRLQEIVKWFDEVQAEGGYREYYKDGKHGNTMQGSGTAGGLGLDAEFFESVLVPQIMLDGFLGFKPSADGFSLDPKLPSGWPEMSIDRIHWQDHVLAIRATGNAIEVLNEGASDEPCFIRLPKGEWKASYIGKGGGVVKPASGGAFEVNWTAGVDGVRFEKR